VESPIRHTFFNFDNELMGGIADSPYNPKMDRKRPNPNHFTWDSDRNQSESLGIANAMSTDSLGIQSETQPNHLGFNCNAMQCVRNAFLRALGAGNGHGAGIG
jgi:hypothetical protein